MKHFIITLIFVLAVAACITIITEDPKPQPEPKDTFVEDLSGFLSTKASAPLEETVWMCQTEDKYNRFLTFKDGEARLFYGLIEDEEFQRWSYFYSAPYTISEDGRTVETNISYPLWGETEYSNTISIIQSDDTFTIKTEKDVFEFVGMYTVDLDDQWISFTINILPWE